METMNNRIAKYALNDFFRLKANELTLLLEEGQVFLSKHKPSIGFWGESILRNFLRESLPSKYNVTSGFVEHRGQISHQCDIIIYDKSSYAPLAKYGDIEIISKESVAAIIEVKNSVKYDTFQKTLGDFEVLGQMGIQNKYVFIYSSIQPKTIESYFYSRAGSNDGIELIVSDVNSKYDNGDFQYLPTAIVSIRSNYILCQDLVVNDRDMFGYTAYRYTYPIGNEVHTVSSIQLFLGMIMEDCAVSNDESTVEETYKLDFDSLQIIHSFGLWDS